VPTRCPSAATLADFNQNTRILLLHGNKAADPLGLLVESVLICPSMYLTVLRSVPTRCPSAATLANFSANTKNLLPQREELAHPLGLFPQNHR